MKPLTSARAGLPVKARERGAHRGRDRAPVHGARDVLAGGQAARGDHRQPARGTDLGQQVEQGSGGPARPLGRVVPEDAAMAARLGALHGQRVHAARLGQSGLLHRGHRRDQQRPRIVLPDPVAQADIGPVEGEADHGRVVPAEHVDLGLERVVVPGRPARLDAEPLGSRNQPLAIRVDRFQVAGARGGEEQIHSVGRVGQRLHRGETFVERGGREVSGGEEAEAAGVAHGRRERGRRRTTCHWRCDDGHLVRQHDHDDDSAPRQNAP
jgi:hypothetical protein